MLLEDVVGTSGSDVYYYHTDRLGSVRALTSSAGGVSDTYTYDDYGKTLTSTGSVYNPFKYTGEYTDQESGFIYLRARYYGPESQQFLTVDPALAWTEEPYAYGGGSPTNAKDPSGLQAIDEWEMVVEEGENLLEGIGEILTEGVERLLEEGAETTVAPKIEASLNLPTSSWIVRAGEPTIKNLTNGYSGGGLSVQWNPGSSVDYLATMGEFPNAQVCFAQYPTLVDRAAQLGYTVQMVQREGGGLYHHELVVEGQSTLPEPIARLWSEIFGPTLQENPLRYLPGGR